jgi:hypothetical protein
MSNEADIKLAKQALSGRLLHAGLRRGPSAQLMAMTVSQAVANAGCNAHAIGIGMKVVKGKATRQKCIRIHVTQKIADSLIPPRDAIPKEIDGIPTDVIESAPAMIQVARKKSTAKARKAESKPAGKGSKNVASNACTLNKQNRQRPERRQVHGFVELPFCNCSFSEKTYDQRIGALQLLSQSETDGHR